MDMDILITNIIVSQIVADTIVNTAIEMHGHHGTDIRKLIVVSVHLYRLSQLYLGWPEIKQYKISHGNKNLARFLCQNLA